MGKIDELKALDKELIAKLQEYKAMCSKDTGKCCTQPFPLINNMSLRQEVLKIIEFHEARAKFKFEWL